MTTVKSRSLLWSSVGEYSDDVQNETQGGFLCNNFYSNMSVHTDAQKHVWFFYTAHECLNTFNCPSLEFYSIDRSAIHAIKS